MKITPPKEDSNNHFYVIGVGTSAGGLDALSKMLAGFNGQLSNMCIIIAQHLSRTRRSELSGILNRISNWPVARVENDVTVQPGTIYVTPEDRNVIYKDKKILLQPLTNEHRYHPTIDDLFASIAESEQQYAIGVILSGTANDGVKGLVEIKNYGGLTIAQTPESAEYPDMALGAIKTGKVDVVLHPSQIYEEIVHYIENNRVVKNITVHDEGINTIFKLLEKRCGTDFSHYKQKTILRRLDKRIEALKVKSLDEYCQLIRENPTELDILFDTMLIGVTSFFRDTDAFDQLQRHLQEFLKTKKANETIRVWSVGCSTGEEPYSIAMLFHEIFESSLSNFQLQIFATDIDEKALNVARKGHYPTASVEILDAKLVEKYFDKNTDGYAIKKAVKQHILFSRHDTTTDPPFVKLDLIVCRNMLIYFDNDLQKEALRVFNYALNENGLLFLGKSENVTVGGDLFEKEKSGKIFRKNLLSVSAGKLRFSRFRNRTEINNPEDKLFRTLSLIESAKEVLFKVDERPFVIVNESGDLKEIRGSVRLYLEIKAGSLNANIYKMANAELVLDIRSLIAQVSKTKITAESTVIKFTVFDTDYFVRIKVVPFAYQNNQTDYYIIIFEKIPAESPYLQFLQSRSHAEFEDFRIAELENEVISLRAHLKTFTESLENNNEEMQAINEELQSANEELKSSNEEMETSNEELQSTNEELHTSNNELHLANKQLTDKKRELKEREKKLIESEFKFRTLAKNIPVMCWTARADGAIYWYNDRWYDYTGTTADMMEGWGWKSVHDPLVLPDVMDKWTAAIRMGERFEMTFPIKSKKGEFRLFLTRAFPQKDEYGNVVQWFGTNTDITEQKRQAELMQQRVDERTRDLTELNAVLAGKNAELDETKDFLNLLINSSVEYISVIDSDLNFITVNDGYVRMMEMKRENIIGKNLLEVGPEIEYTDQYKCIQQALNGESVHLSNHRFYKKDDMFVDSYFIPFIMNGVIKGVIIMKRDVTQIIKTERILAQKNRELNRSNEDLQQFAHVASHDLKEPVRKIKTYTKLVEQSLAEKVEGKTKHYMDRIANATERIYSMINGVLEYSSVDSDFELSEQVDLNIVIENIREDLELLLEEKNVVIESDELETVEGGRILLYQVLYNLIKNSVKFARPDVPPYINIQSEVMKQDSVNFNRITLTDNGIGFEPENAEKIFGSFTRLHSKDKYEGTGLGLALCRKIIQRHGGTIKAEGSPGVGAKFIITLPLKQSKNE